MAETPNNLHVAVEKYIALRDKRDAIMREAKEKAAKIDTTLDAVEGKLMAILDSMGLEKVSSPAGTAYVSTRSSATVADWDATLEFIVQNEFWHMLEKRVNKTSVEDYLTESETLPPGVNYRKVRTLNIRRSS